MWGCFFLIEYLVCGWWRLMVDSPLKSLGQQQSFWPWFNVITKNNGQLISGGKNKINFLSGCSWSVLSILPDSQRTEPEEVPMSMWSPFAEGGKSEEEELCCWQSFPPAAQEKGCSCAARGDQSRMLHPRLVGALGGSCLLQVLGWLWSQLYPGIRMLGQSPPRAPCFPWIRGEGGIPA